MCGIFGVISFSGKNIVADVISGLKRLEYRGYDSAGVGFFANNQLNTIKSQGKIAKLESKLKQQSLKSEACIGHTRWATHGKPSEQNAHPVSSQDFILVMNGIVENFRPLKNKLLDAGFEFKTETDTEVVVMLLQHNYNQLKKIDKAITKTIEELDGRFALLFMNSKNSDLYCVRSGAPIVLGRDPEQFTVASDMMALGNLAEEYYPLQDGEIWQLRSNGEIINLTEDAVISFVTKEQQSDQVSKGKFKHFMLKEIFESSEVVGRILRKHAPSTDKILHKLPVNLLDTDEIVIVACGTSYNAGMIAKSLIEESVGVRVNVCVASEFRYQPLLYAQNTLFIFISQSGETADTLAALEYAKSHHYRTLAMVNVMSSTIANLADYAMDIAAGPEIGVASTKAFIAQCACLLLLNLKLMQLHERIQEDKVAEILHELADLSPKIDSFLHDSHIEDIAERLAKSNLILFIGRGLSVPLALEGALKFKEITYKLSEGLPAGELKHGPIALIDKNTYIVVINPDNKLHSKTSSNMEEVSARGAKVCLLSSDVADHDRVNDMIEVPASHEFIAPLLYAIPLQLISYYAANYLDLEIDQPRNLAKSVTVE